MEKLAAGALKLGISLDLARLEQFETYYQTLIEWNQKINLTAITGYEEAQLKHFLDSLTVTRGLPVEKHGLRVIDVGAGAGFPGLPLKITFPQIELTLLEATLKKTKFLYHIAEKLGLTGIEIAVGRAEELAHIPAYRERFDVAVVRGVAPLPALVELALPFCTIGGRLIAQKKGNIAVEIKQSQKVVKLMGGRPAEMMALELAELPDNRCLVIVEKVASTPPLYPRRPGIPAKNPIVD